MAYVFISYSRKDTHIIDRLAQQLNASAVETWVDREDIAVGAKWRRKIVDAIDDAVAVLVVLSPDAAASDNVRKEIDIAEEARKLLLPVKIRSVDIPKDLQYQLVGLQQIDLSSDFDLGVSQLVETVRKVETSPQVFWHASLAARNELKVLSGKPDNSIRDQVELTNTIMLTELSKAVERLYMELGQLDDEALKQARLIDVMCRRGDMAAVSDQYGVHKAITEKRNLVWEQIDQVNRTRDLALCQLRVLMGLDARPTQNIFDTETLASIRDFGIRSKEPPKDT